MPKLIGVAFIYVLAERAVSAGIAKAGGALAGVRAECVGALRVLVALTRQGVLRACGEVLQLGSHGAGKGVTQVHCLANLAAALAITGRLPPHRVVRVERGSDAMDTQFGGANFRHIFSRAVRAL